MSSPNEPTVSSEQPSTTVPQHDPPSSSTSVTSDSDATTTCPWRDDGHHDRECARFFDCPSHLVARTLEQPAEIVRETRNDDTPEQASEHRSLAGRRAMSEDLSGQLGHLHIEPTSSSTNGVQTGLEPSVFPPRTSSHRDPMSEATRRMLYERSLPPTPTESAADDNPHSPSSYMRQHRSRASTGRDYRLDRQGSFPIQSSTTDNPPLRTSSARSQGAGNPRSPSISLPRWQPDAEVTYCPICQTQFSIFVRKHHCRKCGRVVCNSCSPHRIIIPHQYIVRPPGSEPPAETVAEYFGGDRLAGGERVRLCNPCVPDPQTAPPHSPTVGSPTASPRSSHHRSRSSILVGPPPSRNGPEFGQERSSGPHRGYSHRSRSITMAPGSHAGPSNGTSPGYMAYLPRHSQQGGGSSYPNRYSSLTAVASSSRNRMLPPTPQIAEEDECPICHHELPSRDLENYEEAREAHITSCITNHSTYGTPRATGEAGAQTAAPASARRTGMYKYVATEKDCIDDAECTICLEEFTVGVGMARLECLCRFHKACISAWFVKHPGRCPVHQHDGFGF